MSDKGLSREFLRGLRSLCNTDLDHELMVHVAKGKPYVVLSVIGKWNAKTIGSTFVEANGWKRIGYHGRMKLMSELIRRVAAENAATAGDPLLPEDFCQRFPSVAEFLRTGRYDDGSPRKRSAITLMAGDVEGFKAVLNDPDNVRGVWAVSRTLEGLFVALEALAGDPRAPWKPSRPTGSRR